MNQLYLSSYQVGAGSAEACLAGLQRYRLRYPLGYPSPLEAFARPALASGCPHDGLTVAVTNAQPADGVQRDIMPEVGRVKIHPRDAAEDHRGKRLPHDRRRIARCPPFARGDVIPTPGRKQRPTYLPGRRNCRTEGTAQGRLPVRGCRVCWSWRLVP